MIISMPWKMVIFMQRFEGGINGDSYDEKGTKFVGTITSKIFDNLETLYEIIVSFAFKL